MRDIQIVDCTISGRGAKGGDTAISVTAPGCSVGLAWNRIERGTELDVAEGVSEVEVLREGFRNLRVGPEQAPGDADWHLGRRGINR